MVFRDLWHMQLEEASLGSKVCFGSSYILGISQISSVSKELLSSRESHHSSREDIMKPV